MTEGDVRVKLTDFEGKLERAVAFRAQAHQQAEQAEIGVQQLQGAVAVLRELLAPATNGLDPTRPTIAAGNGVAAES